ncbi:unnamed protein product [Cylicocyclus nassatus]|uniref:Transthyretin-like family protein n=1 Tax=Cylicocyclus nassatus TaxID=53992 RepID=A0AA36GWJ0_CYLNA|nr:unnamed protein product [Cylicocyclus nassatus]
MLKNAAQTMLLLFSATFLITAADKSIAVKGVLKCGDFPAIKILIRLFSLDPYGIDFIEQTHSDDNGTFNISGKSELLTQWRPLLSVHHDCDDVKKPGRRKINFLLPNHYLTDGAKAKTVYDLGVWNLETVMMHDEERVEKITRRRRRRTGEIQIAENRVRNTTASALDRYEEPDERVDPW